MCTQVLDKGEFGHPNVEPVLLLKYSLLAGSSASSKIIETHNQYQKKEVTHPSVQYVDNNL